MGQDLKGPGPNSLAYRSPIFTPTDYPRRVPRVPRVSPRHWSLSCSADTRPRAFTETPGELGTLKDIHSHLSSQLTKLVGTITLTLSLPTSPSPLSPADTLAILPSQWYSANRQVVGKEGGPLPRSCPLRQAINNN